MKSCTSKTLLDFPQLTGLNFSKMNNIKLFTFLDINPQYQGCYQPCICAYITITVLNTLSSTIQ